MSVLSPVLKLLPQMSQLTTPITQTISNPFFVSFAVVGLFILSIILRSPHFRAKRAGARLPPGPEQRFLFGNLFNFPRRRWYEAFTMWQQLYGQYTISYLDSTRAP